MKNIISIKYIEERKDKLELLKLELLALTLLNGDVDTKKSLHEGIDDLEIIIREDGKLCRDNDGGSQAIRLIVAKAIDTLSKYKMQARKSTR